MLTLKFSRQGTGNQYCLDGWLPADEDNRWTTGFYSTLQLPRPEKRGAYILGLRLKPHLGSAFSRRLRVEVNGFRVAEFEIRNPSSLECVLPWSVIANEPAILVQFDHPDGVAGTRNGADATIPAFAFEAISLRSALEIDHDIPFDGYGEAEDGLDLAAEPASEPLAGHIDIYGFHHPAGAWLLSGWIAAAWDDSRRPTVLAQFENCGIEVEAAAFYDRSDFDARGVGIVLFLRSSMEIAEQLCWVELRSAEISARLSVAPADIPPGERELLDAVGTLLARPPVDENRRALLRLLLKQPGAVAPELRFLEGQIDYHGYHRATRCRVICGTVSAWSEASGPETVVARYGDGTLAHVSLVHFFDRADLPLGGKGFILFSHSESARETELTAVEFRFSDFSRAIRCASSPPYYAGKELTERMTGAVGYAVDPALVIAAVGGPPAVDEVSEPSRTHPLFDPAWYLRQVEDEPDEAAGDAFRHYLEHGDAENLDPCALFDTAWYRQHYPDVAAEGVNALEHYLTYGTDERRSPHPLFDVAWYLSQTPHPENIANPLLHYVQAGAAAGQSPHPIFDAAWYLSQTADPDAAACALRHYIETGAHAGLSPHPLFDPNWYLSQTDDPDAHVCPLRHYVEHGSAHGLLPHPLFDPAWYRLTQMVAGLEEEPLCHFLRGGDKDNLDPNPLFSTSWYRGRYADVGVTEVNALCHYVLHGGREGRDPHPAFSNDDYLNRFPDCVETGQAPLVHALSRNPAAARWQPAAPVKVAAPQQSRFVGGAPAGTTFRVPLARRDVAAFLTAEFDAGAARKVIDYFDIVDRLHSLEPDTDARWDELDRLIARMHHLSENADDERPIEASVIVPVYNQVAYTIACVLALLEHKGLRKLEIIIGDDVSTDETSRVFSAVSGVVRYVRHEQNGGFLLNCNRTSLRAAGTYIVLLNNDTFVLDQWLDHLLAPFEQFSGVGLVGSKLLNADGSLQEAGGIIWNDGSGWNFGRAQDATLPEFNYLKDVDYISGASIAVPRRLWEELGGFDQRYVPAYSEDADLAFTLRARGLRTLYSPFSMVIHHEGVSHGRDVAVGLKAYQIENQTKFVSKWHATLSLEQFGDAQHVFLARDRSRSRKHILVIDHYVPQFDRDAGSRTLFEYCRMFVDGGLQVSFWPDNLYRDRDYAKALQEIGVEVLYGPQLIDRFSNWIQENGGDIDYVFVSRAHIGIKYIGDIRKNSSAKILFYGHDLHYVRLEREFEITKDLALHKDIAEWRDIETRMWQASDIIYYPAEDEVALIEEKYPDKTAKVLSIYIYPNEEIEATRSLAGRSAGAPATIMFVAGFRHRPNVDAALWLANHIMPKIRKHVPDLTLVLAGSSPPPEVTALQSDNVIVTGYVSDGLLRHLYQTTTVAVAPLRFGGGVKGKIIEAMSFGVPVATTTAGSQGMVGWPEYLEVGDTPDDFADRVLRLLRSKKLRRIRALHALDYIEHWYSYQNVATRMADDIPELASIARGKRLLTTR